MILDALDVQPRSVMASVKLLHRHRSLYGLQLFLITPFWELREWWHIKRDKAEDRYEAIAKEAQTISLQPLENSAEPQASNS